MAKKQKCYSGIGGQAVLEGIMMKNGESYAVAVRKPDGEIALELDRYPGILAGSRIKNIPFLRGIFNFVDSLILGNKCLNYSASFYDEETQEPKGKKTGASQKAFREQLEKLLMVGVTVFSVALAVGIFILLPYFISSLFAEWIRNRSLLLILEGAVRILIFILYITGISFMKDIRRLYAYHGAEHKCINCVEKGRPLTVRNVMRSSRLHKRCGTSFIFFVLLISIILMFFIHTENPVQRVLLRILLMPVVAGISYEIIRLAGRSENILVKILSAPGMLIQRLTTREPDEEMAQVAIAAVEAVFDWREFLEQNFGEAQGEEQAD